MNSIQKKILALVIAVLIIMITIWISLTYYNDKMQKQYDDILERYLSMNEVTNESQKLVSVLNNYLLDPSYDQLQEINKNKENIMKIKEKLTRYRNSDNDFALTNYENLIDGLIDKTDQSILARTDRQIDDYLSAFSEATSISKYISEMTLTLIDMELKTYDRFYRSMIERSEKLRILGIWLLLFFAMLVLLSAHWFSKKITQPINQLTHAAHEISLGNFDTRINVDSDDEIAFLAQMFDKMRINIINYLSEIKQNAQLENELQESKLLLQESQLRSLQSQINPHFLYNTLDILSKKAYLEGAEETSDLLVSVAGLLRYNLEPLENTTSLFEEVQVLEQYMDIQNARFKDRLKFELEIDSSCLSEPVLRFTLQPIAENAVIHAIEPREEGGVINFRVLNYGNFVRIEIEDNGPGMKRKTIDSILHMNKQSVQGHLTGIGLSNVIKRLNLFYNRNDIFQIESVLGMGTKIILMLPKMDRGEINEKNFDC